MSKTRPAILAGTFRPIVQSGAFLRKETVEVLRQPRLLLVLIAAPFLVLVAAPFLVLLLFAVGYD